MNTNEPIALKKGRSWRPDVFHVRVGGQEQIWKDYRHLTGVLRGRIGRWMLKRERQFLQLVGSRGDAPFPLTSPEPLILAMTFIPGRELTKGDDEALAHLEEIIGRLHAKGIVHNDIHRSNVVVTNERVVLLDFGASVRLPKMLKPLTLLLQHRDRQHVRKLQARFGTQPVAEPTNPGWVKVLQKTWNQLRRKPAKTPKATG